MSASVNWRGVDRGWGEAPSRKQHKKEGKMESRTNKHYLHTERGGDKRKSKLISGKGA